MARRPRPETPYFLVCGQRVGSREGLEKRSRVGAQGKGRGDRTGSESAGTLLGREGLCPGPQPEGPERNVLLLLRGSLPHPGLKITLLLRLQPFCARRPIRVRLGLSVCSSCVCVPVCGSILSLCTGPEAPGCWLGAWTREPGRGSSPSPASYWAGCGQGASLLCASFPSVE